MKTKTAIIGGAFDPIHNGHIAMAKAVLEQGFDEVLIQPCYNSMFGKDMTPDFHRLMMCYAAVYDLDRRIKVSDWEIRNKFAGGTIDFIDQYVKERPDIDLTFVIGMDNALCINKWKNWETLVNVVGKFLVIARPGYEAPVDAWFTKSPHSFLSIEMPDISSTQIREEQKHRDYYARPWFMDKLGKQVPFNVMGYIHGYDLY
ncbi:MAG: nicotinate-nicotinamide nucleotide adenylyltransferase [Candidatus Dojkabacteria bacterium]